MPVVIVIAIVVVLAVVVFVAAGRGGGMPAAERTDYAPLEMGPVSATDIVLLRPPTALWGYSQQATDEALEQIAHSVRDRDVRIVALEQLVTDLSRDSPSAMPLGSPYGRARHARPEVGPDATAVDLVTPVPRPYDTGMPAPEQHDTPADGTSPLGAPVADPGEQPDRNERPWDTGAGGPPEVSHD